MKEFMKLARLHTLSEVEPYWQVQTALLVAILLQVGLNSKLTVGPKYLIAGLEIILVLALVAFGTKKHKAILHIRRSLAILLIAVISLANITSLGLVINELFRGKNITGSELIISALAIYVTNIIIFGLWYWELDNYETDNKHNTIDFLFPQMTAKHLESIPDAWVPTFLDYLYVSLTNASAFSPTDTMPLTHRAKMLMSLQSTISLITVVLVIARAANILS